MKSPCFILALLACVVPAFAQPVISAKSGLLSYAEGDVTLNGEPADFSGVHFSDVRENALVRTGDGRAEVLLTPGVVLRLGENSSLRMISNRLIDTRLELLSGSAVVEADQIAKETSVTLVCKQAVVTLPKAGLYRLDAEPALLKVFKGEATVEGVGDERQVAGGHMMTLEGQSASIEKFDTENTDALDRWSHRRGSYLAMANTSAANSLLNSSAGYGGYGLGGYGMAGWGMQGCSSAWAYNMYFNMMTYMPCYGSLWSPYGYRFWSPYSVYYYSGYAPGIYGGGASRTGASNGSGSASLARPVATSSNRAISSGATGVSRGIFSGGVNRVGSAASANTGGVFAGNSGGFSGGGSSGGGGFGGARASGGAGGGAGGGGAAHAGGGGGGGGAGGGRR